jgi:hypothetical protein
VKVAGVRLLGERTSLLFSSQVSKLKALLVKINLGVTVTGGKVLGELL